MDPTPLSPPSTRVVIADDHAPLREEIRAVLTRTPGVVVVGEAENGHEAARLAGELRPDVVVMDVAMPVVNGIEATRAIVAAALPVKVLALSMLADSRYVKEMLEAGAAGYMLKDRAAEDLGDAIRAVLNDALYLGPGIEPPTLRL